MSRLKDETIATQTSAEIKARLNFEGERENCWAASMMEVLILQYAQQNRLQSARGR